MPSPIKSENRNTHFIELFNQMQIPTAVLAQAMNQKHTRFWRFRHPSLQIKLLAIVGFVGSFEVFHVIKLGKRTKSELISHKMHRNKPSNENP
jgi:hypothetical protein